MPSATAILPRPGRRSQRKESRCTSRCRSRCARRSSAQDGDLTCESCHPVHRPDAGVSALTKLPPPCAWCRCAGGSRDARGPPHRDRRGAEAAAWRSCVQRTHKAVLLPSRGPLHARALVAALAAEEISANGDSLVSALTKQPFGAVRPYGRQYLRARRARRAGGVPMTLTRAFAALLVQWRDLLPSDKGFLRLVHVLVGMIAAEGRHTVTGSIRFRGWEQQPWAADHAAFSRAGWNPARLLRRRSRREWCALSRSRPARRWSSPWMTRR